MCGILGAISESIARDRFESSLDTLRDRGPDGVGTYYSVDGRAALGHRLLSIVGERAVQPIANASGSIYAVVNGEFYDYVEVRARLERMGYRFSTDSDSEILIHLYEEFGVDCVAHLEGEFAFAVWDDERKLLFCARDRFGVKPLVYYDEGDFIVASKARAIVAMTDRRTLNRAALMHAIRHQYAPPGTTLFDGIHTLKPGHALVRRGEQTEVYRYSGSAVRTDRATTEDVRASLVASVDRRLQGDHPVATYLSGGIDSSIVTALVAGHQTSTDAWSVSFTNDPFDERRFARQVATHCGVTLHEIDVDATAIFDVLDDAVFHAEGLAINAHLSAKFLMAKSIRDHGYKVVLTGEGADEVFLGYPHFLQDLHPGAALPVGTASGVMVADAAEVAALKTTLGFTPSFASAKIDLGKRVSAHTTCDTFHTVDDLGDGAILEGTTSPNERDHVDRSAALWRELVLAPYILTTLGDGTEMAHGIEGRTPFLDSEVVATANSISVERLFEDGIEKSPLRNAFRHDLPSAIVTRRKQPFIGPPICFQPEAKSHVFDRLALLEDSQIWNAHKLRWTYDRVVDQGDVEQRRWEPVFMMALTFEALVRTHKLETF